jgi:periplasmic copper chaperone A
MKKWHPAAVAAMFCFGTTGQAHEFTAGALTIEHPMAYETAASAKTVGGYLTIINNGTENDRLTGVQADFPRVELHTTEEQDGVARMVHLESIDLPAGGTVAFEPGGYHVMFMGLGGDPFEPGEKIPARLVFEKAGEVEVVFNVEARPEMGGEGTGHGDMEHSGEAAMDDGMSH